MRVLELSEIADTVRELLRQYHAEYSFCYDA